MNRPVFFYPDIDYRSHPAFQGLGIAPRSDDIEVENMIHAIDAELAALHRKPYSDHAALVAAFNAGPGKAIDKLAAYIDRTTPVERVRKLLAGSFVDVKAELLDEARIHNDRQHFTGAISPAGTDVLNSLRDKGMHASHLGRELKVRLQKLAAPAIARLRERAKENPNIRVAESIRRYGDIGVLLDKYFRDNGILDGLSAFFGSNVIFDGFALEYSHSGQNWWQNCYADFGLPTSRTAYMHYDHGCRNPKAIVALSDVSEDNGPTGYVVGSHKSKRSNFVHFLIKSVDYRFNEDVVKADGDRTYYRPRFQKEEHRKEFLMLPRAFQACSHFGEDIQDDLPLARELLASEIKLTKEAGDCITFDGDYGIHRGALCRSGERLVFQVIFAVQPNRPSMEVLNARARAVARKILKGE
jgi:hypothetical protein